VVFSLFANLYFDKHYLVIGLLYSFTLIQVECPLSEMLRSVLDLGIFLYS
jgi:hypothetical protein